MKQKKRLAAALLNVSPHKVRFAPGALEDIQKAITRSDLRGLIAVHKIVVDPTNLHSRAHARKRASQKRKGRQRGKGSQKGASTAGGKEQWINRIRGQRKFLHLLREKNLVTPENYHLLYAKSKGGYFRNTRHIKLYLTEHNLINKANQQP